MSNIFDQGIRQQDISDCLSKEKERLQEQRMLLQEMIRNLTQREDLLEEQRIAADQAFSREPVSEDISDYDCDSDTLSDIDTQLQDDGILASLSKSDREAFLAFNDLRDGDALPAVVKIPLQYVNVSDEFLTAESLNYLCSQGLASADALDRLYMPPPAKEFASQDYDRHCGYTRNYDLIHTFEIPQQDITNKRDFQIYIPVDRIIVQGGTMRRDGEDSDDDENVDSSCEWLQELRSSIFNRLVRRQVQARLAQGVKGLMAFYIDFDHLCQSILRGGDESEESEEVLEKLRGLCIGDQSTGNHRSFVLFNRKLFRQLHANGIAVELVSADLQKRNLRAVISDEFKSQDIPCLYEPVTRRIYTEAGIKLNKGSTKPFLCSDLYHIKTSSIYQVSDSGIPFIPNRVNMAIAYHSIREQLQPIQGLDHDDALLRALEDSHIELKRLHVQLLHSLLPTWSVVEREHYQYDKVVALQSDHSSYLIADAYTQSKFVVTCDHIWNDCLAVLAFYCQSQTGGCYYTGDPDFARLHLIASELFSYDDSVILKQHSKTEIADMAYSIIHSIQCPISDEPKHLAVRLLLKLAKVTNPLPLQVREDVVALLRDAVAFSNAQIKVQFQTEHPGFQLIATHCM